MEELLLCSKLRHKAAPELAELTKFIKSVLCV